MAALSQRWTAPCPTVDQVEKVGRGAYAARPSVGEGANVVGDERESLDVVQLRPVPSRMG